MSETYLVVGSDGLLGRPLLERWKQENKKVKGTTRRHENIGPQVALLDLAHNIDQQWHPRAWSVFDSAVIIASRPDMTDCWKNPHETARINIDATLDIAARLTDAGCFVVLLSSSKVFDGSFPKPKPNESTSPKSEYGRQKTKAEQLVLRMGGAVVRLTKVFHKELPILKEWAKGGGRAFTNYPVSFITPQTALNTIAKVAEQRRSGIWHVSPDDQMHYGQLAEILKVPVTYDLCKIETGEIVPYITRPGAVEHIPFYSSLDATKTTTDFGIRFETSEQVVRAMMT